MRTACVSAIVVLFQSMYPLPAHQVLAQQGLLDTDSWSRVQDFGWLKAGPSPNWRARQPEPEGHL